MAFRHYKELERFILMIQETLDRVYTRCRADGKVNRRLRKEADPS